jgi:pyruvate dehydrogenase E2 component (dihydrolipoamide acetyltransferase)
VILEQGESALASQPAASPKPLTASPVATRMAAEHNLDLAKIKPQGGRIQKGDVVAYLASKQNLEGLKDSPGLPTNGRVKASPKARRLASERGLELKALQGSGPQGAVLAADVLAYKSTPSSYISASAEPTTVSRLWRVMSERVTQAWTTIPHFYLMREVNASRLISWREDAQARNSGAKITYTDLLVKLVAAALQQHPRVNSWWIKESVVANPAINVGLAVAVEDGLIVPVIHNANTLGLAQLAASRTELVAKAQSGKLSPADLSDGTFTISNLGMYGVDAFNAIVNPPQAAILAVGRIEDRVVPLNGQPAVQPMMTLSLSCDHRIVDGARGAAFLQTLATLIEEPLRLLD